MKNCFRHKVHEESRIQIESAFPFSHPGPWTHFQGQVPWSCSSSPCVSLEVVVPPAGTSTEAHGATGGGIRTGPATSITPLLLVI